MIGEFRPQVGEWYNGPNGRFEVVALDEDANTIEIQYYDGSVDDLETETWEELDLAPIALPEDWIGPYDDLEKSSLDEADVAMHPHERVSPLDDIA